MKPTIFKDSYSLPPKVSETNMIFINKNVDLSNIQYCSYLENSRFIKCVFEKQQEFRSYSDSVFYRCYFNNCHFSKVTFRFCVFNNCEFEAVEFLRCIFDKCIFNGCTINKCNFKESIIYNTDIKGKDLLYLNNSCPATGGIIGWKKLMGGAIAKLFIPEDAKRSSATSNKCRADKALVLGFYDIRGKELNITERGSIRDYNFKYKLNAYVYPDYFTKNPMDECAHGIHFFISFNDACEY